MADMLGYARVSTHTQDLEAQERRLQEEGALRVFEDIVSGRTFDRPRLTALIEYGRPGDRVCVVRLDRLGRSLRELLETVETLKQEKIDEVSLEEKLDTSSAAGELVFQVGQDDRSVTLDYELKGSVRGKRQVAELMELVERLSDG